MAIAGLMAGLGNPGQRYRNTRHNIGFMVLDSLCETRDSRSPCGPESSKSQSLIRRLVTREGDWLLIKPQTYMNLSGQAVGEVARYYRIDSNQILVVHDDLDLPLGRMQLRLGGGSAGHKGVESTSQHLGTLDFFRLRIGIGKPVNGNTVDYVLTPFGAEEVALVQEVLKDATHGLDLFLAKGFQEARQWINSLRKELKQ